MTREQVNKATRTVKLSSETVQLCLTAVCRAAVPAVRSHQQMHRTSKRFNPILTGHSLFDPFEVMFALTCIHRRYRCAAHSGYAWLDGVAVRKYSAPRCLVNLSPCQLNYHFPLSPEQNLIKKYSYTPAPYPLLTFSLPGPYLLLLPAFAMERKKSGQSGAKVRLVEENGK